MSKSVKGCWVYGEDHFARDEHSGREVGAALERHRRQGRVYVAIEDALQLCSAAQDSEDEAAFADGVDTLSSDTSDDGDTLNFGLTGVNSVNRAFQHGVIVQRSEDLNDTEQELTNRRLPA